MIKTKRCEISTLHDEFSRWGTYIFLTQNPLIPFLVIDHISKPFDDKNQKALGAILHGAYTNLQKSEMQIILFDDEDASSLGLTPDHSINLLGEDKSGFNPFYMPSKEDSPNAPEEVE